MSRSQVPPGAILTVRSLGKEYPGSVRALDQVSFDIERGVTGLLGPNGAGKSTLLQCVLGLLRGWSGEARVLGLDARRDRRAIRRRTGFMPESDSFLPRLSALEATLRLARLAGLPARQALRRAHEVLWHVGLGEAAYRLVSEYSVGMRQRFKLAQAIVHDPDLLILDEPLAGLDPAGRQQIRDLIRTLAQEHGQHVVWSSHLLPDVQAVADHVVILDRGRFRGAFPMDSLAGATGRLLLECEGLEGEEAFREHLAAMSVTLAVLGEEQVDGRVRRRYEATGGEGLDVTTLLSAAHRAGFLVRSARRRSESLEDVFLQRLREGGR